ncbi:MAG: response regulator, partial [Planctomycetota bacterium]
MTHTPEDLDVLHDELGEAGYDLVQTWGAEKALEMVQAHPPDLVLLDLDAPEADAAQFCQRLRSMPETEAVPVMVIAQDGSTLPTEQILEIGADGCVSRPFRLAGLL